MFLSTQGFLARTVSCSGWEQQLGSNPVQFHVLTPGQQGQRRQERAVLHAIMLFWHLLPCSGMRVCGASKRLMLSEFLWLISAQQLTTAGTARGWCWASSSCWSLLNYSQQQVLQEVKLSEFLLLISAQLLTKAGTARGWCWASSSGWPLLNLSQQQVECVEPARGWCWASSSCWSLLNYSQQQVLQEVDVERVPLADLCSTTHNNT